MSEIDASFHGVPAMNGKTLILVASLMISGCLAWISQRVEAHGQRCTGGDHSEIVESIFTPGTQPVQGIQQPLEWPRLR